MSPTDEQPLREPQTPDEIAEFYAGVAPVGTYEIYLPSGQAIKCRYPERYAEVRRFFRELREFWSVWSDESNLLEGLKPLAPRDWSEAYAAFLLHFWSADETKYSQKAALKMARNAWVMDSLKNQIESNQKVVIEVQAREEIDAAGKDSPETTSSGSVSASASTSSTDTPTH